MHPVTLLRQVKAVISAKCLYAVMEYPTYGIIRVSDQSVQSLTLSRYYV
jgi:hypothetical protein